MKICDYLRTKEPTFENRLMYAMFMSSSDCYSDWKWGYLDAGRELLDNCKPIEELKAYIDKYENTEGNNTDYDKAYINAYRDYIKQEEEK